MLRFLTALLLLAATTAVAQQPAPKKIQDNSFLLEEAYNQEEGVIQHISNFVRIWDANSWGYTFTEEWPLGGQRHQLSFTVPVVDPGDGIGTGIGDVLLNYRLQLVGSGDTPLAIAPRASLVLPTGNSRLGRGAGGAGVQVNLPVSVEIGERLVTHWNAGTTLIPGRKNPIGDEAFSADFNLGASAIFIAHPNLNLMFEAAWASLEETTGPDQTERGSQAFLAPGIRWAHNFESGLQIVPGIAFPIGVGPTKGENGVLFYLSFEHPFRWAK